MQRVTCLVLAVIAACLFLMLILSGCAAVKGQSSYSGPLLSEPIVKNSVREIVRTYSFGSTWALERFAKITNASEVAILVNVDCGMAEYWDLEIPARTTQSFMTGSECRLRSWKRK